MEENSGFKILTIDDEAYIRQSIRTYLEDYEYIVFEAENGRHGIEVFNRESPDLVLLDLRMPEMDGLQVLEVLGEQAPEIPLVVASGTGNMTSVVEALRLGAWDYIFKPIEDMNVMMHSIEKCLKESRLKKENKAYQERLEELVRERTRELEESEQRYKAVFEYTGTAAIIIEPDDTISMVNSKFAELVGMDRGGIEGIMKWHAFVSSQDIDIMANHLKTRKESPFHKDDYLQYEVELVNGSGRPRYVYVSLGQIPGTDRQVASLLDVTEKKRAEKRWQNLEKQLRKSQKMEAIGTLAGGIAHDLNNILSPVLGYADMIMRTSEPESRVFQRSEKIQKAALRAADLVSQVLAFNRGGAEEKRRIKLHPVAREVVKLLRGSIPSTIRIRDNVDRNCDPVLADPTQIHQVVMNLCTNAYHAMEENGGELSVGLRQTDLSPADIVAYPNLTQGPGTYLVLEVCDTGCGMTEDIMERIFDPYFTTKEEGKGTGLGLATAYSIIQACNGDIRVKSNPGKGTCFSIYIPAVKPAEDAEVSTGIPGKELAGTGERLLVVDDDRDIAAMCKEGFEYLGYRVNAFSSSTEALAFFKAHYPDVDLVVTDQTMPEITGIELAREMLAVKAELPVILCSGYAASINQKAVAEAGIRRFVMKPVTVDALSREIQQLLNPQTV
ncbi:MAG: response regulator [Desulfobacterales bacterium]|nr:response regulator [Desulfobacterales bacterium]